MLTAEESDAMFKEWTRQLDEQTKNRRAENPLYRIWKSFGFVRDFMGWREKMPHELPTDDKSMHKHVMSLGMTLVHRSRLVRKYSWAVPSPEAIQWIAERCPSIVEIGAGRGYWAKLLSAAGVNIVAYDPTGRGNRMISNSWHYVPASRIKPQQEWSFVQEGFKGQTNEVFYRVRRGEAAIAANYPDRTMMLCWPPCSDRMAFDALNAYRGESVLFIGEFQSCGNNHFHARLERQWDEVDSTEIPQWPGMRDGVWLYRRKKK